MATLDVGFVTVCPEFEDSFEILTRAESVDTRTGRTRTSAVMATAQGTIYPTGDNSLVRATDYEGGIKTLTIVTPYRLRQASAGTQPDLISYRGVEYIVSAVEDYTQYGAGFVVAQASSIDAVSLPPQ